MKKSKSNHKVALYVNPENGRHGTSKSQTRGSKPVTLGSRKGAKKSRFKGGE